MSDQLIMELSSLTSGQRGPKHLRGGFAAKLGGSPAFLFLLIMTAAASLWFKTSRRDVPTLMTEALRRHTETPDLLMRWFKSNPLLSNWRRQVGHVLSAVKKCCMGLKMLCTCHWWTAIACMDFPRHPQGHDASWARRLLAELVSANVSDLASLDSQHLRISERARLGSAWQK